ncbi:MAG TPA: hypothetical protein VFB72_17615 [Verrucomicrobiae bacterium]|nr:hypothetical protein [Verrucomicrobiae bacterium]
MSEKEQREGKAGSEERKPENDGTPNQHSSGGAPPRKPENKRRKPGPSVDIGPGPGADVVATPPRRI